MDEPGIEAPLFVKPPDAEDGDHATPVPAAIRRRRQAQPQPEGSGLPFKARRILVAERLAMDVVSSKIENHITSCEGFRKLLLTAVGVMISIIMVPMGFMLSEIYQIKGRQEVVLTRLQTIDTTTASDRQALGERFASVVGANSQRENTFNQRFEQLNKTISDLQTEFHKFELRERGIEYEPSGGPTRRR